MPDACGGGSGCGGGFPRFVCNPSFSHFSPLPNRCKGSEGHLAIRSVVPTSVMPNLEGTNINGLVYPAQECDPTFASLLRSQHAELLKRLDELLVSQAHLAAGMRDPCRSAEVASRFRPKPSLMSAPPPPSALPPALVPPPPSSLPAPATSAIQPCQQGVALDRLGDNYSNLEPNQELHEEQNGTEQPGSLTPDAFSFDDRESAASDGLNGKEVNGHGLLPEQADDGARETRKCSRNSLQGLHQRASQMLKSQMTKLSRLDEDDELFNKRKLSRKTNNFDIKSTLEAKQAEQDKIRAAPLMRKVFKRIVTSSMFEGVFATIIVVNAMWIGFEVEFAARNGGEADGGVFDFSAHFFCFAFTFELTLRLFAEGVRGFFLETNVGWNLFDFFLVSTSVFELFVQWMEGDDIGIDPTDKLSNIRLVRIVRISRLLRLLRIARVVRLVRALRILIHSILSTLKSLVWAMILMGIIIYSFAILFTQSITDFVNQPSLEPDTDLDHLMHHWGSLARSMFTLYLVVTGGKDWEDICMPVYGVDPGLLIVLLVYISFIYFAVLNVVTGVFCQTAIESAQHDRDLMVQSLLNNRERFLDKVKHQFSDMFHLFDDENVGGVAFQEFESHINDPSVQAYFALLELNTSDAWSLFQLLDTDDTNCVDAEEFVDGCLRLKGGARSIDLALMRKEHRLHTKKLRESLQADIETMMRMLGSLGTEIDQLKAWSVSTFDRILQMRKPIHTASGHETPPDWDFSPTQPQYGNAFCPGAVLQMAPASHKGASGVKPETSMAAARGLPSLNGSDTVGGHTCHLFNCGTK